MSTGDNTRALFNGVIQIGIVVADVNKTIEGYRDLLHIRKWNINHVDTVTGKGSKFQTNGNPIQARAKIAWMTIGNVEFELIEPRDEHSVYAEFLRENGPGIHHVMLGTSNYTHAVDHMDRQNVAVIGGGELQDTKFQMFDTTDLLGFICEIADGDFLIPDEVIRT